jgi:hypothetical protein
MLRAQFPDPAWRKAILLIGVVVVYRLVVSNKRESFEAGLIQSEHLRELVSALKIRRFEVLPYARVPVEVKSAELLALALMPSL